MSGRLLMADSRWQMKSFIAGTGQVDRMDSITRLSLPKADRSIYSDAQLDNYAGLARRMFPQRPPVHLSLRARFSSENILGTAGFGFWNHPFAPNSGLPTLPRAVWFFFASPPSNLQLALDVPGFGWKAATIDAARPSGLALAPLAPLVLLLSQSRKLYRKIWPFVQRCLRIAEQPIDPAIMREWHTYSIDWQIDRVQLSIDDRPILNADRAPRGPLGFVAWIDNQFAIVTPRGRINFGLLQIDQAEWLEIDNIHIVSGD
jgi:hypothetical protein